MATTNYMTGRKKYTRPQAMLWAENPGDFQIVDQGLDTEQIFYIPSGYEVGADLPTAATSAEVDQFIILSDDNRSALDFSIDRIEKRERMINGRMRSYHVADKLRISTSWDMLPSRGFSTIANFNSITGRPETSIPLDERFTTDGGAGGVELLDWYNKHTGSFWVYLSYDNYKNFGVGASSFNQLQRYSQIVEVFISDFSYSVSKRGGSNYDFWNVSVTLEEV